MSVVKTTRVWDGITLNEFTDTSTGAITIKSTSGVLLASSVNNSWIIEDLTSLTRLYNNAKIGARIQTELSEAQVKKEFFNNGIKIFNEDRASVLNNTSNYSSNTESNNNRDAFFVMGIQGIVQPTTKRSITSGGGSTSINSFDTQSNNDLNFEVKSLGQKVSSSLSGAVGALRYPLGALPDLGYDFVEFKSYEYDAGDGGLTTRNAEDRLGNPVDTIVLPIVAAEESNSINWGDDRINALQAAAGQFAFDAIGDLANLDFKKVLDNAKRDIKDFANQIGQEAGEGGMDAIKAHFAGQAVGANLLTRQAGQVLNNNLELLFEGPNMRTFAYNFKLRPRNQDESQVIKKIIRSFKKNSAPKRSTGNIFLLTPNIFTIKYVYGATGGDHPYMNKIKPCALRTFRVNYTPDNSYMTYGDGGLTGYDISLTFGEIQPIYADDHDDTQGMSY